MLKMLKKGRASGLFPGTFYDGIGVQSLASQHHQTVCYRGSGGLCLSVCMHCRASIAKGLCICLRRDHCPGIPSGG